MHTESSFSSVLWVKRCPVARCPCVGSLILSIKRPLCSRWPSFSSLMSCWRFLSITGVLWSVKTWLVGLLWAKPVAGGGARPLEGNEGDQRPADLQMAHVARILGSQQASVECVSTLATLVTADTKSVNGGRLFKVDHQRISPWVVQRFKRETKIFSPPKDWTLILETFEYLQNIVSLPPSNYVILRLPWPFLHVFQHLLLGLRWSQMKRGFDNFWWVILTTENKMSWPILLKHSRRAVHIGQVRQLFLFSP